MGLKISDFGWKGGVFSAKIREKGVFSNLGSSGVYALDGSGGWATKHHGDQMMRICVNKMGHHWFK